MSAAPQCNFCQGKRQTDQQLVAGAFGHVCELCILDLELVLLPNRHRKDAFRISHRSARADKPAPARCSFCQQPGGTEQRLIDGPGVAICDLCIRDARGIVDSRREQRNLKELAATSPALNEQKGCLLLTQAGRDKPWQRTLYREHEIKLGAAKENRLQVQGARPRHAKIVQRGAEWLVHLIDGATLHVNGAKVATSWALAAGDQISIGETTMMFYPVAKSEPLVGQPANGFSRARHYIAQALAIAETDRHLVEQLAELEEVVDRVERNAPMMRAVTLMNKEKWHEALKVLGQALKADPRHARALFYQGLCLAKIELFDDAEKSARAARDCAGADKDTRGEAEDLLKQIEGARPQILLRDAIKLMKTEQFAQAITLLELAIMHYVPDADLYLHLGICQAKTGLFMAARASFRQGLTFPCDSETRQALNRLLGQLG